MNEPIISNPNINNSYQKAGVDIDQANSLVSDIKKIAKLTRQSGVVAGIGGFGAAFELPVGRFKHPILVSSTDGVGTKLKLAVTLNKFDTIGIDLVAMCANDILCLGAEPLFFLDYFATGKLILPQAQAILSGIGQGCKQAGTALIGGETAEMPGLYQGQDFDLAGFCVGAVEKSEMLDGSKIKVGDLLIGIASTGFHSNGYSLIRHIIEQNKINLNQPSPAENTDPQSSRTLGEALLAPTRIYVPAISALQKEVDIHGIAHITGGGLIENVPRILPKYTQAIINLNRWQWPQIFRWLQNEGNISDEEMLRTFNVGIGMVVCIQKSDLDHCADVLKASGEQVVEIGYITSSETLEPQVQFINAD